MIDILSSSNCTVKILLVSDKLIALATLSGMRLSYITRGDGTPLDASSIMEENIVEICVRRAHLSIGCAPVFCGGVGYFVWKCRRCQLCTLYITGHDRLLR